MTLVCTFFHYFLRWTFHFFHFSWPCPSKTMQTPLPTEVIRFLWKILNVLKNEKWILRFSRFLFFELWWKFIENWPYFEYLNDRHSKNKNRKYDFSFNSAHSASFMWIWPLLKCFFFMYACKTPKRLLQNMPLTLNLFRLGFTNPKK